MRAEAQSQYQGQRIYRREGGQAHTANARGGTKPNPRAAHTQKRGQPHTANARGGTKPNPRAAHTQKRGQPHTANARGGTKPNPRAAHTQKRGQPHTGRHKAKPRGSAYTEGRGAGTHSQCAGRHKANPRGSAYTEGKEGRHTQPMRGEAPNPGQVRGKVKLDDSSPTRTSR